MQKTLSIKKQSKIQTTPKRRSASRTASRNKQRSKRDSQHQETNKVATQRNKQRTNAHIQSEQQSKRESKQQAKQTVPPHTMRSFRRGGQGQRAAGAWRNNTYPSLFYCRQTHTRKHTVGFQHNQHHGSTIVDKTHHPMYDEHMCFNNMFLKQHIQFTKLQFTSCNFVSFFFQKTLKI
jgi:hypothetical protein